ncbi:PIG-L deacetylase family protein [Spirillospora sp. CA-294931]|uniref:PIG-L deacetylase family protein n=1 Tax=Spirillospora sp. CA-294931 TaxID=3240042 RepID=UPI003D903523
MAIPCVLAVFAHPDDAELACGGTLSGFRDAGYDVHIVTMTNGSNSSVPRPQDRVQEAASAASVIGATITIEDLPDGEVRVAGPTYAKIERHMRELGPSVVITHHTSALPLDDHQDHQATGLVATTLAKRAVTPQLILQGEPPVLNSGFSPNFFVDVTEYMAKKLVAVAQYESEAGKPYMKEEALLARGQWWARQAQVHEADERAYYEAYQLIKCRSTAPHLLMNI